MRDTPDSETGDGKTMTGYIVGTLTLDSDGVWRMYYVGPHQAMHLFYFGNGYIAFRNIRKLFDIVGSRLNRYKQTYLDKIQEVLNAPSGEASEQHPTDSTGL